MTVKNNFKKQRKDTKKRKQRDTKRTAIKTAGTFKEAAKKKKQDKNKYSPEFIRQYVAEHGIERAVHDLKLKGDDSHFTNQDIMRFIHDIIPSMIHPHAAIEILETLESEGKVTISDEFRELIKSYDILVREVNWDINNIITFIEEGKEPEYYLELMVEFFNKTEYMFDDVAKAMIPFFEPHADLLDQFYQEHRHDEQEAQYEFASRQHDLRSKRIYPAVVPPVGVLVEQSEEAKETPVDSQEVAE